MKHRKRSEKHGYLWYVTHEFDVKFLTTTARPPDIFTAGSQRIVENVVGRDVIHQRANGIRKTPRICAYSTNVMGSEIYG